MGNSLVAVLANRIELWPVDRLKPYERNARTHSAEQVEQIASSMIEFGFTNPVLVDSADGIIAGHGRLMAAKRLNLPEVPVIVLDHLTDEQRRAYILADNKLALNAGWDEELLAAELASLHDVGYDLSLTGFSEDELDELLADDEEDEPSGSAGEADEIPDAVPSVSAMGDVWHCGKHRVMCGDSTDLAGLSLLMGNEQADLAVCSMVFTDPPWNVNYGEFKAGENPNRQILNDNMAADEWAQFTRDFAGSLYGVTKPGAPVYLVMSSSEWPVVDGALRDCGFHWSSSIIWVKDSFVIGRRDYHSKYEPIWYGWNDSGPRLRPLEDRTQCDVWEFPRPKKSELHPTTKPVALITKAITNSSDKGSIVVDLFGGSGSTMIACQETGRIARLCELDPKFVDVIVRRWENFTGKQATLGSTGQTFAQVAAERDGVTAAAYG